MEPKIPTPPKGPKTSRTPRTIIKTPGLPVLSGLFDKEVKRHDSLANAQQKELSDLVFQERFIVEEVLCDTYATSIASPSRIGGPASDSQQTGYRVFVDLTVKAVDATIPVQKLMFNGYSAVRAGDTIDAKIPRYRSERNVDYSGSYEGATLDLPRLLSYFDREYNPSEIAVELQILSSDGKKVLRTERSVLYKTFVTNHRG